MDPEIQLANLKQRRTHRLIPLGSCTEQVTEEDPAAGNWLVKDLDGFPERLPGREPFDLPAKEDSRHGNPD